MTAAELASRLLVVTVLAFALWLVLLRLLGRVGYPLGGIIAAVLSWGGASAVAGWVVGVLQRSGHWPLV
jgi:uncharacterized transporter YbjL